ncbi:MAG: putative dependent oxidoreductase family protein [Chlamydiia bacterium]|nr:putative dependent oxidoreductase family protein [Chlamydiia bacterium]
MNIAIIGAGFSGLSTCWNLLNLGHQVTLFDRGGIGAGASGIAAGLIHPFMPAKAALSWQGREGIEETLKLLKVANYSPKAGILRPCITEELRQEFLSLSEHYPDTEWWSEEKVQERAPLLLRTPALFIQSGFTVNCKEYLQGLWKACVTLGAQLVIQEITSLEELQRYDRAVVTIGASHIKETKTIPLTFLKGQILELDLEERPPLPFALNAMAYLTMSENSRSCFAGATFERDFITLDPEPEKAEREIRQKLTAFSPIYSQLPLLSCRAGVRACTRNRLPAIVQLSEKAWCLTGMGSKGLLYHALLAKKLCIAISES